MSVASICGIRLSRFMRGPRPNRSSKGVMFGNIGSGRFHFIQQAGEMYSSHLLGQATHSSASISSIHPPRRSTTPRPPTGVSYYIAVEVLTSDASYDLEGTER